MREKRPGRDLPEHDLLPYRMNTVSENNLARRMSHIASGSQRLGDWQVCMRGPSLLRCTRFFAVIDLQGRGL